MGKPAATERHCLKSLSHLFTLDTLFGFSGPRSAAEEITRRISTFLRDELRLERSAEQTLITHARTRAARFLGFEGVALAADHTQARRGQRCMNGAVRLKVAKDGIVARCRPSMRKGKAVHRPARLGDDDFSIVRQYQAAYDGFVQDSRLAMHAHRLRLTVGHKYPFMGDEVA